MKLRHLHNLAVLGLMSAVVCLQGYVGNTATMAYFNDTETSVGNYLRADPIDFSVNLAGSREASLRPGDTVSVTPLLTLEPGSHPARYRVEARMEGGDVSFCSALQVYTTSPLIYSGSLLSLHTDTTNEGGPWTLNISLQGDAAYGSDAACEVKLLYTGWEDGLNEGSGYGDTEEIVLVLKYRAPAVHTVLPEELVAPAQDETDSAEKSAASAEPAEEPATEEAVQADSDESASMEAPTSDSQLEAEPDPAALLVDTPAEVPAS